MDLCVASNNPGKIREFKTILEPLGFNVQGLKDLNIDLSDFEETGTTFEENAALKAKHIYKRLHIPVIADDSGLVLEAFPEILGVYSARFMGEDTAYELKNQRILAMYEGRDDREAKFVCALCYVTDKGEKCYVGEVKGTIAHAVMGEKGFGYDPIFIPCGYVESFAQLSNKNSISHRSLAIQQFLDDVQHEK